MIKNWVLHNNISKANQIQKKQNSMKRDHVEKNLHLKMQWMHPLSQSMVNNNDMIFKIIHG